MNHDDNNQYSPVSEKAGIELKTFLTSHKTAMKIYLRNLIIEGSIMPSSNSQTLSFIKSTNVDLDVNTIKYSELNCHFTHKNDMYFFKSQGQLIENKLHLSMPETIFKLQRRENFRVYTTAGASQSVVLPEALRYTAQLKNISLSGCQISLNESDFEKAQMFFQTDSHLKVKIQLFDFIKTFDCKVKFIEKSKEPEALLLGLHFEDLSADTTEDLQAAVFKLDRHNRQIKEP